jgi:hypothetical protein
MRLPTLVSFPFQVPSSHDPGPTVAPWATAVLSFLRTKYIRFLFYPTQQREVPFVRVTLTLSVICLRPRQYHHTCIHLVQVLNLLPTQMKRLSSFFLSQSVDFFIYFLCRSLFSTLSCKPPPILED